MYANQPVTAVSNKVVKHKAGSTTWELHIHHREGHSAFTGYLLLIAQLSESNDCVRTSIKQ